MALDEHARAVLDRIAADYERSPLILTHGHSSSGWKYAGSPGATSIPKNDMSSRLLEVTVLNELSLRALQRIA